MPAVLETKGTGEIMHIRLSGKLTAADYRVFVPEMEKSIARFGRLRLLIEMVDFHGWDVAALWEDLKFDLKHFADIDRLAMVGDKSWQRGMTVFCKPFTTAEIRFFEPEQMEEAQAWLLAP